ncbi:thiamine biosynthesis protein ThiS [Longibacter salinarum]|uniref:Thiamine biosynthesis protein ThiS n=1 Tax=Longibacter salinarum TaxID=1850348 RepID=A0A2A8D1M6_9BACT|nr:sulfur carrier protein ThiS [Longibacter salinarum]PEN14794.1 thiamine biosynthesis protein ThiS [Longibacter salinarum]
MSTTDSDTETVEITVNGAPRSVPQRYPLTELLNDLNVDVETATGVAVAINESVIRRQDWADVTLSEEDTVEVITAQQGG